MTMQAQAFLKHDPSGSSLDHSKSASLPPQLTHYQRGAANQTRGTATLSSGGKSRESLKRGQEYTLQDLEKITSSMKKRTGKEGKKTRSSSTKRGTLGALVKGA